MNPLKSEILKWEEAQPKPEPPPQPVHRLGRRVSCVSRALGRPSCPPFVCGRGKRRILWLEPNARLLGWLQNWTL